MAGLACAFLVMGLSLLSAHPAGATTNCVALEVRTAEPGGSNSTLLRVDTSTGSGVTLATLGYQVNAIGYSSQQNLAYGIAAHRFGGADLVRIAPNGQASDLGPVHGTFGGLDDAVAGAVMGSRLYVRAGGLLYAIGIDPRAAGFGTVLHTIVLRQPWLSVGVDDFDVNPADGLLYGISALGWQSALVSIDPNTGTVREVRTVQGLPGFAEYGSVVLAGSDLVVLADDIGGHSRLYRLPLSGSGPATPISTGPADGISDLAGCLATAATPTTTTVPPTTTRVPPPPVSGRPAPPPPDSAVVPPPVVPPTTTTTTVPPTSAVVPPIPAPTTNTPIPLAKATTLAAASDAERNQQRRWALTTVIIIFGGGAVAARASSRARKVR